MKNNTENVKNINKEEVEKINQIKIEGKNIGKIMLEIRKAEKGCRTGFLSIIDIEVQLDRVENQLNITKKSLEGTEVTVYPKSMDYVRSNSGSQKQTAFTAVCHNESWYLTRVFRSKRYMANPAHVVLSEVAKEAILRENTAF